MREDPSGMCVFRVGRRAQVLAQELGWPGPDTEALEIAARRHGIGEISVADDIVAARAPLKAEELQSMRARCRTGADLLRQTERGNARRAADVAAFHHAACDGSGYPHGIGGTAIPLEARIVAIADAFMAMTGDRPHRARLGVDDALEQLRAGAGRLHDPRPVPLFIGLVRRLHGIDDDLDACLAKAANRSPPVPVNRQPAQRLAEPRH